MAPRRRGMKRTPPEASGTGTRIPSTARSAALSGARRRSARHYRCSSNSQLLMAEHRALARASKQQSLVQASADGFVVRNGGLHLLGGTLDRREPYRYHERYDTARAAAPPAV